MDEEMMGSASANPPEPMDLNEAFKMLKEPRSEAAQGTVGTGGGEEPNTASEPISEPQGGTGETLDTGVQASGDYVGGSADDLPGIDYNPVRQQLIESVNQQAVQNTAKMFRDQNVRMYSIDDLYRRDERTGQVTFVNPDAPNGQGFQTRAQAQEWIDSMNGQIQMRFAQEARKEQRKLMQQQAPRMRLIEFAPTYNGLDQRTKDILDDIVEPYAINDGKGNVVGFNCDLNAALRQAQKIVNRFPKQEQQAQVQQVQQQTQQGVRPAMDIKAGSGAAANENEPKDLAEAMLMYRKQQKGNK